MCQTTKNFPRTVFAAVGLAIHGLLGAFPSTHGAEIGREVAVTKHLQDGEEYQLSIPKLAEHGKKLFSAVWTIQEGGGRPLTKGTGAPLSDPTDPLVFPRNSIGFPPRKPTRALAAITHRTASQAEAVTS